MHGDTGPRGMFAIAPPQAANVARLQARSRVVGIENSNNIFHATALAVDAGCPFLYGLFSAKDGRQLSVEDLDFLNTTVRFELYEPAPRIEPPKPRPKQVSFKNFRRALGLDPADADGQQ